MSALTDTLRKQHEEARKAAAEGWAAFEAFRKEKGDDEIAKDKDLFEQANALHGKYGEAADAAKEIEHRFMKALDMDGSGPSLKDLGEDAANADNDRQRKALVKEAFRLGDVAAEAVIESPEWKAYTADAMKQSSIQVGHLFQSPDAVKRASLKTLLTGLSDTQGGAFLVPDRQAGIVEEFDRVVNVMTSLITLGQTDTDTVEWVAMTGVTNNAAETLEAVNADKAAGASPADAPESAIAFDVRSTIVQEIKHYIPATKRSVADAGQLRTIVDSELLRGLADRVDLQVLQGNGTNPNLRGIMNTAGLQTQTLAGGEPYVETIHKAITKLIISGVNPNGITALLNANDWQTIRLSKDANGNYFYGPPSTTGPRVVWGYPVAMSQRMDEGSALAGDFKEAATLWLREGATIAATDSHSDWFIKGIIAILAGTRAAFAVKKPRALCEIDFTP